MTQSAQQGLACLLDFPTGGPMGQGRNRPLDKEHISPFLWRLPELAPDASVRSVGFLIYEVPSFLHALGFFSQLRRWEKGEKE